MARRWTFYLLTVLVISCIVLFTSDYAEVFPVSKLFNLDFSTRPSHDDRELSIKLHSKEHILRRTEIISLKWNISQGYRSPDGVRKLVYLINGEFPGPTIEVRSGDFLNIVVQNNLDNEGVAFHWHGLRMNGANGMDGAIGITQNPINPGQNFTYNFHIDDNQTGTFWYHSHSGLQRADGLYGGLIIHKPADSGDLESSTHQYEDENLLLVGDWYHRSAEEVRASYVNHDSWGREPVPDSLLINGMGAFNCSMAVPSRPLSCTQISNPRLRLNQVRTRFRVANVGAISGFILSIPQCHMTVFQLDGGNAIEKSPKSTSVGILYPGERMDVIVECDPTGLDAGSQLSITLDAENFAIQNKALTLTHNFPISLPTQRPSKRGHSYSPPKINIGEGFFDLTTVKGAAPPETPMSEEADQTILLYTKMEILAHLGNVPVGFINRTTWAAQSTPLKPLIELEREKWDNNQLVPWIPISKDQFTEKWVDIVVNNLDEKGHPFHLHGYDFYILTQYYATVRGYHAYNPYTPSTNPPGATYNLDNPSKKDTVYIPSQGYVVLRILADNIGIWFFHCHILWHSETGMAMALEVGYE